MQCTIWSFQNISIACAISSDEALDVVAPGLAWSVTISMFSLASRKLSCDVGLTLNWGVLVSWVSVDENMGWKVPGVLFGGTV